MSYLRHWFASISPCITFCCRSVSSTSVFNACLISWEDWRSRTIISGDIKHKSQWKSFNSQRKLPACCHLEVKSPLGDYEFRVTISKHKKGWNDISLPDVSLHLWGAARLTGFSPWRINTLFRLSHSAFSCFIGRTGKRGRNLSFSTSAVQQKVPNAHKLKQNNPPRGHYRRPCEKLQ